MALSGKATECLSDRCLAKARAFERHRVALGNASFESFCTLVNRKIWPRQVYGIVLLLQYQYTFIADTLFGQPIVTFANAANALVGKKRTYPLIPRVYVSVGATSFSALHQIGRKHRCSGQQLCSYRKIICVVQATSRPTRLPNTVLV